jgi:hypothetical protein
MNLTIGDWVRSYSAGIWRIYDILTYKCLNPVTNREQSKTTVFLKRFVGNNFKKAFTEECCDPSFVKPLSVKDSKSLTGFIEKNSALFEEFSDYNPQRLDCIYNAGIMVPRGLSAKEIELKIPKDKALRDLDIDAFLRKIGLNTKGYPQWTAQFVSKGFETEKGYLMFRFDKILKF